MPRLSRSISFKPHLPSMRFFCMVLIITNLSPEYQQPNPTPKNPNDFRDLEKTAREFE